MKEIDVESTIIATSPVYGDIELLGEVSRTSHDKIYKFRYTNTGYEFTSTMSSLYRSLNSKSQGRKDPFYRSVAGVGYIGMDKIPMQYTKIYLKWKRIIEYCYDQTSSGYKNNGAKGVTVCERWHCFANFLEDYLKYNLADPNNTDINIRLTIVKPDCKEYSFENCDLIDCRTEIKFGEIYHSNSYGDFIPIKYIEKADNCNGGRTKGVLIKFVDTGYETITQTGSVINGEVKDKFRPTIAGVGYLGDASIIGNERLYHIWVRMLDRCYNKYNSEYMAYGGAGVIVCERWHCFANFLDDVKSLPGYSDWDNSKQRSYHLDKDMLQQGKSKNEMVYSPETCMFISMDDNLDPELISHHNNSSREYYGVIKIKDGQYRADITMNGVSKYLGTFCTVEAAANARDWWARWNGITTRLNTDLGIPYMKPEEWCRMRNGSNQMYHLIDTNK